MTRARRVAVLGGGLGGLVAAGELARDGAKVTLFEASDTLGGKARSVERDGVRVDTGPTVLTMPHVVRDTFARLNASDLLPRLLPVPLQCRYHWLDGQSFEVRDDLAATLASASHLGDGEAQRLRHFYEDAERVFQAAGAPYLEAPYRGPLGMLRDMWSGSRSVRTATLTLGTLDGFARGRLRSEHLIQFAGRFATYAGASPFEASAAYAMIAHLEQAQGIFHPEGGLGALARALAAAVQRLGVTVHLGTKASYGRHAGALLAGRPGDQAEFDAVVVNGDPLVNEGNVDRPLALSGYVLLLSCDRRLDLPHHSILFGQDSRAEFGELFSGKQPEHGTLSICHPAATDGTMAPEGRSGLFLMLNAPPLQPGDEARWVERAPQLREDCLARLRAAFPALNGASLTVLGERTPVDLAQLGAPRGSIYGFLPHGRLGPFRRPSMKSRTPGVFFAGGGTHPGGGVPLVMRSGQFAAQAVGAA